MVNTKSLVLSCIFILSIFAVIPVAANANPTTVTPAVTARATQASYVIASAHNYANSYTYTWPAKTVSGATQIRVHFTRLEVEATYDKVYILNAAGTTIQTFGLTAATSTYSTGVWSSWVTGDTLKVKLTTDSSVTKWGFATDLIEYNTGSGGDTTAPTVSISAPTAGATVSGTTTISATASDNVGVSKVEFLVDSVVKSTDTSSPFSYAWDTTGVANGAHTLVAKAYDAANNIGTSTSVSVTVSNTVTIPTLTSGVAKSGSISTSGGSVMYQITVPSGCTSMLTVVSDPTSADFDSYGKQGSQPTTSSYTWRGYTSNHPESVTYANPAAGVWYIMVKSYSGTGSFTITCTLTTGGGGGGAWGTGGKYAVIVGISDYASINDLSFCDEDAKDWYTFLTGKGYECHVFYDGSYTSNTFTSIPTSTGAGSSGKVAQATEANVRAAIQGLAAQAVSGNQVAFVTSGHGSGDGAGSSYLCMYDCSGSAGCYYDTELKADFNLFVSGVKIFVFVDHCYSGGLGPEMSTITAKATLYMTTTCTANGYGYDDSAHSNGAWTYYFLENYLVSHSTASMEAVFDATTPGYPYTGGDAPMEFDGNTGAAFYL